jgi:hypothetical protein
MSLQAYLSPTPVQSTRQFNAAPVLTFDDNGYYWFLEPIFAKIRETTGQYIDLYGEADFYEGALLALQDALEEAHDLVSSQPDHWDVIVGRYIDPDENIYCPVKKQEFVALLQRFEDAIRNALLHQQHLVFLGD